MTTEETLAHARTLVDGARRIVALTGAGISTESGIPDFRGPQGVWTKDPEAEKLATLQHYMASRDIRTRAWQSRMRMLARQPSPNEGHRALVALEERGKLDTLITQNIDGLHQVAGSDPARIVEIHGTVRQVVCMACGDRHPMEDALARVRAGEDDPPCKLCGGILKSATISFGQSLVAEDLMRAERAARDCDLLIAIGTTLSVFPIAGVVPVAHHSGAKIIIINADPTEMDALADVVLRGAIGELLPAVLSV